jgi:hypothetical protein
MHNTAPKVRASQYALKTLCKQEFSDAEFEA